MTLTQNAHTTHATHTQAGDIYMRFMSFANVAEWKKAITDKQPIKLDLGACYNVPVGCLCASGLDP